MIKMIKEKKVNMKQLFTEICSSAKRGLKAALITSGGSDNTGSQNKMARVVSLNQKAQRDIRGFRS